ncbi:MAG: outer-membrane lipoprotein carrier protein LolA [Pyrinomonadaceae bacterium]
MKRNLRFVLPVIASILVLGGIAVTDATAQPGKLGEILRRMDAHNKTLLTLRTDVTMGKQNAQLGDDPEITTGTAIYAKRPAKDALARIDWKKPLEESIGVVDGRYTLYRTKLGVAYTGSSKDKIKDTKGNSLLGFMNMSKAELDANYKAAYLGEATLSDGTRTVQLGLTPKNRTSYKSAELWIDVDGMPRQSKVVENNNDTTTVLLTNLKKNPSLKTSDFEIKPPKGTKIVKS